MKKNKNGDLRDIFHGIWKIFLIAFLFFMLGILITSMLIYREILPISNANVLFYIVIVWTSLGTTISAILIAHHYIFLKSIITQMVMLALLLLFGMLANKMAIDWISFGSSLVITIVISAIALMLFGGIKKKKFKKNSSIRLKKK